MATRSSIAMKTEDGKVRAIYCHWDGYVDYNGRMLVGEYTDPAKVSALMDLGDLSSLRKELGEKHNFDRNYDEPELEGMFDDWCLAYGRDRGETDVEAKTFDDVKTWVESMANSWCEYFYLWDGRDWIVSNGTMDPQGYPEFDFLEVAILKSIAGQEA